MEVAKISVKDVNGLRRENSVRKLSLKYIQYSSSSMSSVRINRIENLAVQYCSESNTTVSIDYCQDIRLEIICTTCVR